MNYNNCNGWNEYAGTYEGAYYAGGCSVCQNGSCRRKLRKYCGRSRSRNCRVMRRNRPDLRFILAGLYGRVLCQQQM